jgi:hypothetical protein
MKIKTRRLTIFIGSIVAFLLFVIIGVFAFRGFLLNKAIAKVQNKFKEDYNCNFVVKNAGFEGLSGVALKEITLVPFEADTLLSIKEIKTKVNLSQLLSGDIQLNRLELKNGFVQLVKNKNGKNFDAFLKSKKPKVEKESGKKDYAERAYAIISKVLNLVPENISLENLSFKFDNMGRKTTLGTNKLELKNNNLQTSIHVQTNSFSQNWNISGFADPRNNKANLKFGTSDKSQIRIPYIEEKYNLSSSFDSIVVKVDKIEMEDNELHIDGYTSIKNLTINHKKISKKDVVIKNTFFDYKILLGSDFISINKGSVAQLNGIKVLPYVEYNTQKDTIYKLKVDIPKMKSQEFISSLPLGLFPHFEGMEAQGDFDYNLDFKFNINKPNRLVFNSKFNKHNLKITKYGAANLSKLNGSFTYRAIDNGVAQRGVFVGAANPNFTTLEQISPYLRKCVIACEDPTFFSHRGFVTEAFKQSIVKNFRTKKFARGASTISMQLVKNVFLNREKTLSRKLEEILLVYILENNRIASKDRMLEVYFNVIEWGPNVYGIGEASQFYFQKTPSELNLKECLFLATIVPKPKKFMYQFDEIGELKPAVDRQQEYIRNSMIRRGILSIDDTIKKRIVISGRARSYLNIDSIVEMAKDSIFVNHMGDF